MENTFNFESALGLLKQGKRVGRADWKNARYVFLVDGSQFEVNRPPLNQFFPVGTPVTYRPHVDMCGSDGSIGTWSPSMVDLLAEDWYLAEPEASQEDAQSERAEDSASDPVSTTEGAEVASGEGMPSDPVAAAEGVAAPAGDTNEA